MPRGTSYIQIEGIFETEVLGAFNIIRGFATLQDLAQISVPVLMSDPRPDGAVSGHQRPIDDDHADRVKRYFESNDRRFIPEVILSLRVPMTEELDKEQRLLGLYHNSDGLELRRKNKSKNLPNHLLKIHKGAIERICSEKRIRRIDGNHRLSRANDLQDDAGKPNQYKIPFCLLLLGEVDDASQDYTEALLFHTINSTALPLEGERALQLILGQPDNFTQPPHLEFAFSPALHLTRLLDAGIRALPEPARTRLGGRPLAQLSLAAKELVRAYPSKAFDLRALTSFAEEIVAAINDVSTQLHSQDPGLCRSEYFIELVTHIWIRSESTENDHAQRLSETISDLSDMARWVGADGILELTPRKPLGKQLIDIYDEVRSRIPKKVFLARWYPPKENGQQLHKANNRLQTIKSLVEDEFSMELVDLGTQEGGTFPIHQSMYEAIGSSEIMVVDLTGLRPNVMIELGYSLNHMGSQRLLMFFNPIEGAKNVPFDTTTFRYESIDEAADIPGKLKGHIAAIIQSASEGKI